MNVVSIMAHQDDEMRCLGTMLRCRARGDKLFFVTLTDGSKGFVHDPAISREKAALIRHQEMSSLAGAVGAKYVSLDEHDEFLYDTPDVRMRLIEVIRQMQPHIIFTHYHDDYNADHTTTTMLVRHCAMQACLPVLTSESHPMKEHPAVFMVEPFGPISFPATHYVDVGEHHDEKLSLLGHHQSQEEAMQAASGEGLGPPATTLARYRGILSGCRYAECFIPMPARGAIKPYSVLP